METDSDLIENIKACRTCGIHYVTPSKHQLKHLFQSSLEHSEIMLIRLELSQWNVEVAENDGFPQYVCNTCIHKFEQVFELRAACINAQHEFRKFYAVPNGNIPSVKVKTERPDPDEEQAICDFIYVDDLSDEEYDGATPFNFPHIPIKEEIIEAATIPMEDSEQPSNMVESASRVVHAATSPSSHISELMANSESVAAAQPAEAVQKVVDKIECKLCQHLSPNQAEHDRHMQRAHETRDFECHICGKVFKNSTSSRLKFHMKWHTLNKHVKCNLCGFMCNSKEALREHKRANHRKLNCKICEKSILARKMKSHMRQHELTLKYSCEYCTEAFATENERESHIWQIHANEDNNISAPNIIPTFQTTCSQTDNENQFKVPEEILCQEPQEEILYKFMCAHCEHRFIEQIDLETHVNEEHRNKSHLASVSSVGGVGGVPINETVEMAQNENVNEHENITVFGEYDNDNEIHILANNDSSLANTPTTSKDFSFPSTSSNFLNQTETIQNAEGEITANTSSLGKSEETESEDETNISLPSYVAGSLNTFACAKCSETFISIEQLRQHHEQHLASDQQPQKQTTSPNKLKFKCNLCGKTFDLKFSLNRHIKKHKHAPF